MKKRKRFLSLALALVLCLGLVPIASLAADSDFVIEDGVLTNYRGSGGDVAIPDGVTAIGEEAFSHCANLTSVTIPASVTAIGDSAFFLCERLTSVTIPASVTTIGDNAFAYCVSLTDVTLSDGVTTIGEGAFVHCERLPSVTIPASVTSIGENAFAYCYELTNLTIAGQEPTEEEQRVRAAIEALKSDYPEGTRWTNDNSYYSSAMHTTGRACTAFAFLCSDAAFGDAPVTGTHSDFDKIRVGDILLVKNNTHAVVVLEKRTDSVIVTEGNYKSFIHWGRQIYRNDLEQGNFVAITRWGGDQESTTEQTDADTETTSAPTAYQSTQSVLVDGEAVTFQCYALKDANGNLTNYIKLRDLADILNGSNAQFQVGWDGDDVTITTKTAYTSNGSEGNTPFSGDRAYQESTATTKVNGQAAELDAFVLSDNAGGGYTYYQLRDLGQTIGFNVGWSAEKGIFVETDKPYDPAN